MLLPGFGQAVPPGPHGLSLSDAFVDVQNAGAPLSDQERLMALMANPLTPHQPPRADPPADPSTYYSGCVRAFTPPEPLGTRDFPPTDTGAWRAKTAKFARQVRTPKRRFARKPNV